MAKQVMPKKFLCGVAPSEANTWMSVSGFMIWSAGDRDWPSGRFICPECKKSEELHLLMLGRLP